MDPTHRTNEPRAAILHDKNRASVPWFPVYSQVRHLLRVWPGFRRTEVTGFHSTIARLRGTPQSPVDWTDPEFWIPERLHGNDLTLVLAMWEQSEGEVNPRHTNGHWRLTQKYALLRADAESRLSITPAGLDFLNHLGGEVECAIDEAEGVIKLLSIVADNGPAQTSGLIDQWGAFLLRRSSFNADSVIADSMRRRLRNLAERALVERNGNLYSVTQVGLDYLEKTADRESTGGATHHRIRVLVSKHEKAVRETLLEFLQSMDPNALEYLIKRLLEEMDYRNVEVTAPSGDGGVDVVGDIELGITSIREVVQVKRHRKAIQRQVLDALRGSLHRFGAVRGTIISTSSYSSGTQNAAF